MPAREDRAGRRCRGRVRTPHRVTATAGEAEVVALEIAGALIEAKGVGAVMGEVDEVEGLVDRVIERIRKAERERASRRARPSPDGGLVVAGAVVLGVGVVADSLIGERPPRA